MTTDAPRATTEPDPPEDDRIIGVAFRWSMAVLIVVGLTVAGAMWWYREPDIAPVEEAPTITAQRSAPRPSGPPAFSFVDVAAAAGVDFVHQNGATGQKLLPESMGGGCAIFDHDGDGDQDLLFVNGRPWPGSEAAAPSGLELYENDGRGGFKRTTKEAGLLTSLYGMGVAVGDTDNDGDADLFVTAVGENRFFRNDGGVFVDITVAAGVAGEGDAWSTGAGFFDYDNDGFLDLFVCNYVRWSPEIDLAVDFQLVGLGRAYGPPTQFGGTFCYLYRNRGDGSFEDVGERAGIQARVPSTGEPAAKALAMATVDFDGDGWLDLFVANDTVRNFLFRNRGDGTFEEVGMESGVAFDSQGRATGAMGVDCGYCQNDGRLALAVGNFANEMTSFFVAQELEGFFSDEAIVSGVGPASRKALTFGLLLLDVDLDGHLDLIQANGHIEDEIAQVQPSQSYRQSTQLFWNTGAPLGRCFTPVAEDRVGDLSRPIVGRGVSCGDLDGDGDLDLVLTQIAGPPLLLRNDGTPGHHWLRVQLEGRTVNRDAVGSWVELRVGDVTQRRPVTRNRSYLSQTELAVTFGLGTVGEVDTLEVVWPNGERQSVTVPGVDRTIKVVQAP